MKMILIVLFLFSNLHYCSSEKNTVKEAENEFWENYIKSPLFLLTILNYRINLGESYRCGGDAIGTALGYNNDKPAYPNLQENQEITSAYFKSIVYEYQATKNSNITITILEKIKIDTSSSINCSTKESKIWVNFCNGKRSEEADISYQLRSSAIGQIYSKRYSADVKYFININSIENECNLKINLRSNTL